MITPRSIKHKLNFKSLWIFLPFEFGFLSIPVTMNESFFFYLAAFRQYFNDNNRLFTRKMACRRYPAVGIRRSMNKFVQAKSSSCTNSKLCRLKGKNNCYKICRKYSPGSRFTDSHQSFSRFSALSLSRRLRYFIVATRPAVFGQVTQGSLTSVAGPVAVCLLFNIIPGGKTPM